MKIHMEEWIYISTILDLCTRWRWLLSFTPRPFYPRGKNDLYPLDRRLTGPESLSGRCEKEKNFVPTGNRTPVVQPVTRRYTDWAIPAPMQS
jgi:hypothetical protein